MGNNFVYRGQVEHRPLGSAWIHSSKRKTCKSCLSTHAHFSWCGIFAKPPLSMELTDSDYALLEKNQVIIELVLCTPVSDEVKDICTLELAEAARRNWRVG